MSELTTITCGKCGVDFAIPTRRLEALRDDGETFYCPNGHPRAYNNARTREELKEDLRLAVARRNEYWERALSAEHLARRKQHELRTCPLCRRGFRGRNAVANHLVEDHGASDRPALSIAAPRKQIGTGS